jgi:hypothetical protein
MVSFDKEKIKAKLERRLKPKVIYLKNLKNKAVKIEQTCSYFFQNCENVVIEFAKNIKVPKLIFYECERVVVRTENSGKIIVGLEIIKSKQISFIGGANRPLRLIQIDYSSDIDFDFVCFPFDFPEFRILCYNSVYIRVNQKLLPVNNWDIGLLFHIKGNILCCVLNIAFLFPSFARRSENIDDFAILRCLHDAYPIL